ncbi:unnamed protein product [Spirodela intermedia]|uniref:Uncharacterized protein n=1 Tax=Spirodela intermedia TaxID=51605 RepID=A0A7I8IT62_SPIIN|nr:unnamed protein product [Spirodela intermedia]CAA6660794.1 unnamed protein product [Spirodela intermedia]
MAVTAFSPISAPSLLPASIASPSNSPLAASFILATLQPCQWDLLGCSRLIRRGKTKAKKVEVVIPDPDYRIPLVLLGSAGWLVYQDNLLTAAPVGLLGLLLLFQTTRVRFVFDEEALEVKVGSELQESGENVFVGGKNRWNYTSFVNWELWWPNFPILVYFKETQTKPEGQVHFFPVIFNGKQLYDVMVERAGPSKTSGPKQD